MSYERGRRIIVPRRTVRSKEKPKGKAEAPIVQRPVGICLRCGEPFNGPKAIRLQQGRVHYRKIGKVKETETATFQCLKFEDHSLRKWICLVCAFEGGIIEEDSFEFTSSLHGLTTGWCTLCHRDIEPWPLPQWSTAVLLERVVQRPGIWKPDSTVGSDDGNFKALSGGHLHYMCMDDLDLELWRLIERSDTPDWDEYDVP